ncbi:MAG: 6-carboxytetrahydropterin synthase [Clostridiales bacterium]|nr:6-carboxytetrahydropterin synthase [Clostridiales bacterium]
MLRYYRIKAYLNASHFVVFDGKKGDTHPHTWEFVATVYTTGNNIIKFTEPEKMIMKVFEPYQNQVLNEIDPFSAIIPSLENITEYFAKQIDEAVKPFEYHLRRFEGSETPVRTYGVRFPEKHGIEDENEADEVEAALGRLERSFEFND